VNRLLLVAWLLLPLAAAAYHSGPGQEGLALDRAASLLSQADAAVAEGEVLARTDGDAAAGARFALAAQLYGEALLSLPAERVAERRRVALEQAKAQMHSSELPAANASLRGLVDELADDAATAPALLADARASLANSEYYMTWLARLEGRPREQWEPRIESARQTWRLLTEEALARGDGAASARHQQDLEAAIRLARMDLDELQGLPLPSQ